jgi:hypothetical protein
VPIRFNVASRPLCTVFRSGQMHSAPISRSSVGGSLAVPTWRQDTTMLALDRFPLQQPPKHALCLPFVTASLGNQLVLSCSVESYLGLQVTVHSHVATMPDPRYAMPSILGSNASDFRVVVAPLATLASWMPAVLSAGMDTALEHIYSRSVTAITVLVACSATDAFQTCFA